MLLLDDTRLRLAVWRRRPELDAELAAGLDPAGDEMLRLRAEQLTSSATRRLLARALRSVVEGAEGPSHAWGSVRPPLQRQEVLAARDDLLALADRLSEPRVVDPGAAACAAALVWDSGSPVYSRDTGESVAAVAQDVLAALDAAA